MTISDFVQSIDSDTPEKILVQASSDELKNFSGKLRVCAQLLKILYGAKIENVIVTEFSLMLTLSNNGKVYLLDGCKYGVTLSEIIPPEPLILPNGLKGKKL